MDKAVVFDISHAENPPEQTLILRQGDTASIGLDITIKEKGGAFDATDYIVRFMAALPNGTVVIEPCTPIDATQGRFVYPLPSALSSVPGTIDMCYIQIVREVEDEEDEIVHSTDCMTVKIRKSIDITAEEAENYISEFLQAKETIDGIIDDSRAQMEQQQTDYEDAEANRDKLYGEAEQSREALFEAAEEIREEDEGERKDAELKRKADFADMVATWEGNIFLVLKSGEYDEDGTPTIEGKAGITYLVPKQSGESEKDSYYEWIWIGKWERIGSTDLTIESIETDKIDEILNGETLYGDEVLSTTGLSYLNTRHSQKAGSTYVSHIEYEDHELTFKSENGTTLASFSIGSGARIAGLEVNFNAPKNKIPVGYLACDGGAYLKEDYPELYAHYGDKHNPDDYDDPLRFHVPDYGGRVSIGTDESYPLFTIGGEAAHKLILSESPSHTHSGDHRTLAFVNNGNGNVSVGGWSGPNDTRSQIMATSSAGGNQPHNNMQPYYTTNVIVSTGKIIDGNQSLSPVDEANRIPGIINAYGGEVQSAPAGWLPCDGSAYSKTAYPELYAVIGDHNNPNDWDDTKFCVPDLGGSVVIGSSDEHLLGETGGEEAHKLEVTEMPSHQHGLAMDSGTGSKNGIPVAGNATGGSFGGYMFNTGGNQPHNNMQPYTVCNYIISTGKVTDNTGNLVTAGIANGAVTPEKLSSDFGDWIIETGQTDGWTWTKWASGRAECFKRFTKEYSSGFAWNNGWGHSLGAHPLPFEFDISQGNPHIFVNGKVGTGTGMDSASTASAQECLIGLWTSQNNAPLSLSAKVEGFWKPFEKPKK